MKVVAIDNDEETQYLISLAFEFNWRCVKVLLAGDGREGLRLLEDESPDMVILDPGLPDMDGFEILGKIQSAYHVPVIVLTAKEDDVIKGLDAGAADYITKPFHPKELVARVWAIARRFQFYTGREVPPVPIFIAD